MKSDYRDTGVLQIALVNRKLSAKGRRQGRVFISFFQLLAIPICIFYKRGENGLVMGLLKEASLELPAPQ